MTEQNNSAAASEVLRCPLIHLEETLQKAFDSGLTPLIVDTSVHDRACTFYSYQPDAILLEAKSVMINERLPMSQKSRSLKNEHPLEPMRRVLVNAMKFGKLMVIRMGRMAPLLYSKWNDEHFEVDNTLNATAFFSREVLVHGGRHMLGDGDSWAYRLFRESDMYPHKNIAYCLPTFRVCVTTQFALHELDEYLFSTGALPPREAFQIIEIQHEAGEDLFPPANEEDNDS
jgi:hypothetical protein